MVQIKHLAVHFNDGALRQVFLGQAVTLMTQFMRQTLGEVGLHLVKVNTVLRALWPSKSRDDVVKVQFQHGGVGFFCRILAVPKALGLRIGFHAGDGVVFAPCQPQIIQRAFVNREETAGGAVFRGHVCNGGSVSQREGFHARPKEFDEFANHAVFAQHFNDTQRHVRGGHSRLEVAGKADTNDVRCEHVNRLTEHDRFGFNTAYAPAQHAQTVHHGGVGIGANQRIGQPNAFLLASNAGQELEVHLVDDAS